MIVRKTPRCVQRAIVRYALTSGKWLNLCPWHLGDFLAAIPPKEMAGTLKLLVTLSASRQIHCDRPARGRDAVRMIRLAMLGPPDEPAMVARELAGRATDLQHALRVRPGADHAATVHVAFGDVAARFAVLAAALDIDFDAACLAHARGLAGAGLPDDVEDEG